MPFGPSSAQDVARTRVTGGFAKAMDAVNIFDEQYFGADLENEALQGRRVAGAMADQITLQLAMFFRRRAAASE